MNLQRRLRALERVVIPPEDDRCEVCGCEPGSELKFAVSFGDDASDGPDACPGCGWPLIFTLSFNSPPEVERCQVAAAASLDREIQSLCNSRSSTEATGVPHG